MKLGESDVLIVFQRRRAGWTLAAIAAPLGVSPKSIEAVVLGKSHRAVMADHPDRVACVRAEVRKLAARQRERNRRGTPAWKRKLTLAVRDYWYGHSVRAAAARHRIGASALYRELVRRGIARRPGEKRSPQYLRGQSA